MANSSELIKKVQTGLAKELYARGLITAGQLSGILKFISAARERKIK